MDINVCGLFIYITVEALVSGQPRVAKIVPVTRAGHLRECENTEFVWESRKTGFCEGGGRKCPLGKLTLLDYFDNVTYFPALAAQMVGMNMPFREKFNWLKTHREN